MQHNIKNFICIPVVVVGNEITAAEGLSGTTVDSPLLYMW